MDFEKNLATGKPVTSSGETAEEFSTFAVDGFVECKIDPATFWGASPAPQWIMVDLEKETEVGEVQLFTYWDDKRYYQYAIELSTDGKTWTKVVDAASNTTPADEKGYRHAFGAEKARYVKVTMLKNSAGPDVEIVEIRVHGSGK